MTIPSPASMWAHLTSDYHTLWYTTPHTYTGVKGWLLSSDLLSSAFLICIFWMLWCWVVSVVSRNHSQVDKLWSFIPPIYVWYFAVAPYFVKNSQFWPFDGTVDGPSSRVALMAGLATLWGIRLTYNFARKGGYEWNGEDYRWEVLRKKMGLVVFELFNVVFICVVQHLILFGLAVPAYIALQSNVPLNVVDYIAAAGMFSAILGETIADQQQWNFHQEKKKKEKKQKVDPKAQADVDVGFLRRGLFRYSRHPNFFCEMSVWWFFALFAVAAAPGQPKVWAAGAIGTLSLTLLFQGSTTFTERITGGKYPEYKTYQKTTSRLIPCWPCGASGTKAAKQK